MRNGWQERLVAHWVYGAALMTPILLIFILSAAAALPPLAVLTLLALPIYTAHQYEEHDGDRFRQYVNQMLPAGRRGLSLTAVFWINTILVWAPIAAAGAGVAWLDPAFALFPSYLLAINAIVHIGPAIARRAYNPGLWTAATLMLPYGALLIAIVPAGLAAHVVAAALVVAIHGFIVALAMRPVV